MKLEALAKLTARAAPLDAISRGGSTPSTGQATAAALSGLSEHAMALAMVRYVGDVSPMPQLAYAAWLRAVDVANRDGWRPPRGSEIVRKMAKAAIFEAIEPHRCGACNGTGYLSARACHRCGGTGNEPIRDATLAQALGVDKSNYSRTWKPRYQAVKSEVGNWVTNLDYEVRAKIRNW